MDSTVFRAKLFLAVVLVAGLSCTGIAQEAQTGDKKQAAAKQETKEAKQEAEAKKVEAKKPAPKKVVKKKKATPALSQTMADTVKWRSIGPANMSGRITAITVYEKDPSIWWAATASGGLLKTTNNGNNFEHQFDDQATVSIGDVQVAQSNPDIVWVGTGESNPRNSVSWGDGVYKSTDGGKTWKNMGLKKTFQTGALAIHPENPDVVWVGSLGRLWGPNPERGLFKTTDGGKTWKKTLYINDKTGVIDVQVNPKNPDEMLVATYERKRDGFDGNDPVQRFGDGSGIYKSTDGGESFTRITEGLPSCKLGRIGLDYFESDPNVVVAILESEKIGKEPENYSYIGIRGADAEAGAKMTRVTKDGPADKAGLKDEDIVLSVDGRIIPTYREFLKEIHKKPAGEKSNLIVLRDKKLVDIELTLGKRPKSNSTSTRARRTDFTGTLGGQAANLQDTQGKDGHQYGGVYLSEDGGSSWKRINSLNPRPMYYSNIQIDPVDRNNIYVCGTSLYKSKDGGKEFTGDGGSDGIHVDHHALWIDKRDPRHMILGNDGGVHVTYDRMTHWDHINNVAIGQFYHVGVDSNLNYKVYGGLQDNGSWGGPSRTTNGTGSVNSDWFRVGGGDGFVTLADPDDPNQIYFESQNGGMGRIHLETGARGFIRPRQERGKPRFRFNWKTPFMLSPHNSKIHYSAGNHVFRSFNKGDGTQPISPDITNSKKGAGSAITESHVEPGVLYVGTTDGAVWVTKNGGGDWTPLFYSPVKEEKEDSKNEKNGQKDKASSDEKKEAKPTESKEEGKEKPKEAEASADDPITGVWEGKMISDRVPEDRAGISFTLKLEGTKITGELEGRRGPSEITSGSYNPETKAFSFEAQGQRGSREFSGRIEDGKMVGDMSAGGGRFEVPFEASRKPKGPRSKSTSLSGVLKATLASGLTSKVSYDSRDDVSGEWTGVVENENLPGGKVEFTLNLKLDDKNKVSGVLSSPQGDAEITEGVYNPVKKRLIFSAENDEISLEIQASVADGEMSGKLMINDGAIEADFTGTRQEVVEEEKKADESEIKEAAKSKSDEESKSKESKAADAKMAESKSEDESAAADDKVSGKWTGTMSSPQGEQEFTVVVKRKSDKEITGTFESSRGEREINSGTFDPETNQLNLVSESDQFTLEFIGKVTGNNYVGELEFNGGTFTMEFELEKTGEAEVQETADADDAKKKTDVANVNEDETSIGEQPMGEKSLSKLMPGSRWVSSLEASHFKKGRCYVTFDGHRSDDDGTYAYVTNDYGQTWKSLTTNLPENVGSARVIREDVQNENLLFLGCEFSSWYSIDAGETWTRIKGGLPTVAVHEFAIHPIANEVVAGTHGRSLWVADITLLRQLSKEKLSQDVVLYKPKEVIRWQTKPSRGNSGTRRFVGTNPNSGVALAYSLGKTARRVTLEIFDLNGEVVKQFEDLGRNKGLHVQEWDLRSSPTGGRGRTVSAGNYLAKLKVDGEVKNVQIIVKNDPSASPRARAEMEKYYESLDLSTMIETVFGSDND